MTNTCLRGVLAAISIPIFTEQLEKAILGTNQANARSVLSAASSNCLATDDTTKSTWAGINGDGIVYYTYNCSTGNLEGNPSSNSVSGATEVQTESTTKASAPAISIWKLSNLAVLGKATYKKRYFGINASGQYVYVGYSAS